MKYAVVTFGCRVNQADSLGFEEQLLASGAVASSPADADLIVVNTCSVTATSDQGARQTIRRISRDNPEARIVVTGCYATRRPHEVAALPHVARVFANDDKPSIIPLLLRSGEVGGRADAEPIGDGPCGARIEPGVAGRTAFTLRVQTGCGEPCSYCIIPSTRGAPRSVPLAHVLGEVDRITASGFKEIALTGVHLGSYGRDLEPRLALVDLLRSLDGWRPDAGRHFERAQRRVLFRISSLEPMDCSREIVDLVAASDRFAPHFHLPLQHASNRMLTAMRRPYTIEYYAALVDDIRARIPHASIGADVIAGFPGETDNDADELASYLERSPLTHVHVFPYSDRPGTLASTMGGRAPGGVVRARAQRLRQIGARLSERFRESQIGTTHAALTLDDGAIVVTGNYLKLPVAPARLRNEWVTVRVVGAAAGTLRGEIVAGPSLSRAAEPSTPGRA